MPHTFTAPSQLSFHAGDWLLIWRRAPGLSLMSSHDDWSAQIFPGKAELALELWRRWGSARFVIEPSPRLDGALISLPSPAWRYDYNARSEAMAVSDKGAPLSIWALIAWGAQQAEALGLGAWERLGYRATPARLATLFFNGHPVPGCGRSERRWRAPDRRQRLGSGSRKHLASDALAAALDAEDFFFESPGVEGRAGSVIGRLRSEAAKQRGLLPCRYDDHYPRGQSLPDRSAKAKALARARGAKFSRGLGDPSLENEDEEAL